MLHYTILVLAVFALELSPCCCQFGGGEMGGAMGEMMAGGMGGLGAMMGGGMGGLMGGGMGGGMGTGIGSMIRQRAMTSAMDTINDAVTFIVGPQAKPDQVLIDYAMSQRGPPRSTSAMLRYLPHFQRLARETYGAWLADIAVKTPANATATTGANNANPGGKSLTQLQADLDTLIMERSIEYMNRPQTQQRVNAAPDMSAIGMMIPAMVQGIAGAYM